MNIRIQRQFPVDQCISGFQANSHYFCQRENISYRGSRFKGGKINQFGLDDQIESFRQFELALPVKGNIQFFIMIWSFLIPGVILFPNHTGSQEIAEFPGVFFPFPRLNTKARGWPCLQYVIYGKRGKGRNGTGAAFLLRGGRKSGAAKNEKQQERKFTAFHLAGAWNYPRSNSGRVHMWRFVANYSG